MARKSRSMIMDERNANKIAENLEKDSNTLVAFVEEYENEEKPFNG